MIRKFYDVKCGEFNSNTAEPKGVQIDNLKVAAWFINHKKNKVMKKKIFQISFTTIAMGLMLPLVWLPKSVTVITPNDFTVFHPFFLNWALLGITIMLLLMVAYLIEQGGKLYEWFFITEEMEDNISVCFEYGVRLSDTNTEGCLATIKIGEQKCIVTGENQLEAFKEGIISVSVLLAATSGITSVELKEVFKSIATKQL